MTEKAKVVSVHKNSVTVECNEQQGCKSCNSMFCSVKNQQFEAVNTNNITLQEGDIVLVYLPPGKTIFAGFMVLIFPLLLFIFFFLISGLFFSESSDGIKALFGVLGLGLGFVASSLYGKFHGSKEKPIVVSCLEAKTSQREVH